MGNRLLKSYARHSLLNERRTGRKILNSLKNQIVRDILYLITGRYDKTSVPVDMLSIDDYDHLRINDAEFDSAYLLYGYTWRKKIDITDLDKNERDWVKDNPEIDVSVVVIYNRNHDNYNVAGGSLPTVGDTGIDVVIELPKNWGAKNFQALQAELGNTILHELEHLTQSGVVKGYDRGERYYEFKRSGDIHSTVAKDYLLKPDEVAAHVIGYSDAAKSMQDLEARMRKDLGVYVLRGALDADEVDSVIYSWMDWARRNLHQKRFNDGQE